VIVRGEENPDRTVTAQTVGGDRLENTGRPRVWEMGKDFVAGEVKAVDRRTSPY